MFTSSKRGLQSRGRTTSKNVSIGIGLAVIALISCALAAYLVRRLTRESRKDRRSSKRVDLLEEALEPIEDTKEASLIPQYEKPLPPPPTYTSADAENHSELGTAYPLSSLRTPSPTVSAMGSPQPNAPIHANISATGPFATPSHSRMSSASSIEVSNPPAGHSRSKSNDLTIQNSANRKLSVVNLTDSDPPRPQPAHIASQDPPEYMNIRGRDPPFPQRAGRKPPSQTTIPANFGKQKAMGAPVTPAPPAPEISYTVVLPSSDPDVRRSGLAPPRPRTPLTITASRPVSNVVVENTRSIRRPDGVHGKSRLVTMSILVEESESGSSIRSQPESGRASDHSMSQLLESYRDDEADPPLYTPRNETT